jgi:hypothetical protein
MNLERLTERYAELKEEATDLAGGLEEIPRRVVILDRLYRDSGGNHVFSLIAAHGALWASRYFEVGGALGRFIARRYFYSPKERAYRLGLLDEFARGFRKVNRQVCIDTYANYQFVKDHGQAPGVDQILPPTLLDALHRIHEARCSGRRLTPAETRRCFEQSFRCEQEVTVAPGVKEAVSGFQCRIMKALCLRPFVRFAYFPWFRFLFFRDFSDQDERIAQGMRAFDLAERAGWTRVRKAMHHYGIMPARFFDAPDHCFAEIQESLGTNPGTMTGHRNTEAREQRTTS